MGKPNRLSLENLFGGMRIPNDGTCVLVVVQNYIIWIDFVDLRVTVLTSSALVELGSVEVNPNVSAVCSLQLADLVMILAPPSVDRHILHSYSGVSLPTDGAWQTSNGSDLCVTDD